MNDLRIIKKKYGENMAKLCRSMFPTLLETEGLLPKLLLDNFSANHNLFKELVQQELEIEFRNYIYSLVERKTKPKKGINKTPEKLLNEAGYDLYECKSEEDIQKFKKYYASGEKLCTFQGGRLDQCRVFFAVKKDVDQIKREDYQNPKRQDKYGTSVISIQFTKDSTHTLSIKNRYNHTVNCPDSTFSNNLDNIIEGLTESFEKEYGLVQQHRNNELEIAGYVRANDGKYYPYNYELNNVYYCPNNIIIDNFEIKKYEKEKYIVMDYFIVDLVNKEIKLYDKKLQDSFPDTIKEIENIEIKKEKKEKTLTIKRKNKENIEIVLNDDNQMIKLSNSNIKKTNKFLFYNEFLKEITLSNLEEAGDYFLGKNYSLERLSCDKLKKVGNGFLYSNNSLKELLCPNLEEIGDDFFFFNNSLKEVSFPNLQIIKNRFLFNNRIIKKINCPKLKKIRNSFLHYNNKLEELSCPNLEEIGDDFLYKDQFLKELNCPNLEKVGDCFLFNNYRLEELISSKLKKVGDCFLYHNNFLTKFFCPNLEEVGDYFLFNNYGLEELISSKLKKVGDYFLYNNNFLTKFFSSNLEEVGIYFLEKHPIFNKDNIMKKEKKPKLIKKYLPFINKTA